MTPADFRRMTLSLPGVEEGSHLGHGDFRVGKKIFATLGYPDKAFGTVMVKPHEQDLLVKNHPRSFIPAAGAWGRSGSTSVRLSLAPKRAVALALESAWNRRAPARLRAENPDASVTLTAGRRRRGV